MSPCLLAQGADRGVHITTEKRLDQEVLPLAVAKLLKSVVEKEAPGLVSEQCMRVACSTLGNRRSRWRRQWRRQCRRRRVSDMC